MHPCSQYRFGRVPIFGHRESDIRILHLDANLPPSKTRPEVLMLAHDVSLLIRLSDVEPSKASFLRVLTRRNATPSIRAWQFALAASSLR